MPEIKIPTFFQCTIRPTISDVVMARGPELDDIINFAEGQLRSWAALQEADILIGDRTPWLKLVKAKDGSIQRLEMAS
jgi:hypothetical protein